MTLGLMKTSLKLRTNVVSVLSTWEKKFSKFSDAELKEGIFIGPQICVIINDDLSEHLFTETVNLLG
jgi:hypothetical protein